MISLLAFWMFEACCKIRTLDAMEKEKENGGGGAIISPIIEGNSTDDETQ